MRRHIYLGYLLAEVIVIIAVTFIFKLIADRQVAATVAGTLFVGLPLALLLCERLGSSRRSWFFYGGVLQFWVFFALPILGLRLCNWGVPFDQLSILGISGPALHVWSSKSYMVMMAATTWAWWHSRKKI